VIELLSGKAYARSARGHFHVHSALTSLLLGSTPTKAERSVQGANACLYVWAFRLGFSDSELGSFQTRNSACQIRNSKLGNL
jgi:hypothetical protein